MGFCIDKNDQDKQKAGTWVDYDGGSFLVAHFSSSDFQRALNREQAPYKKKVDKGTLDPKISKRILCKAMAEGLLLDWKEVENRKKEDIPYSKENATAALMNDDDFREFVQEFSMESDNYRAEQIDETVKQ
jgi:hypothetical protein